jgi:hypothetical protein
MTVYKYSKHSLYCVYIYARNIIDVMKKKRTYSGIKFKHNAGYFCMLHMFTHHVFSFPL